jgi:tRNA 2-thiouridine synthesizing protein D
MPLEHGNETAMKFALVVYGAPHAAQGPATALAFARAAVKGGHEVVRVFFYLDGVHNASALAVPPQDERDLVAEWAALAESHGVELAVCIAASLKRGVIGADEAERYEKPHHNLHPAFTIAGLGQLIDAAIAADRVLTFAP